jgi:hypothetical protein
MRMGVLDDAIREHLDLKRARGGDPAEIERMEREALGPVRRESPIGSTRFDSVEEPSSLNDEQLAELEDLQEPGYHDSTAPHPHPHHEHVHPDDEYLEPHPGFDDAHPEHLQAEEPQQPKRRFLRRNRPASLAEPGAPDPGFHELPPTEFHELPSTEHDDLLDSDPLAHDAHEPGPPAPSSPPPALQFDSAPKRPRFTAEPPDLQPETADEPAEAPEPPVEPVDVAPPPPPAAPAPPAPPAPAPAPPAPERSVEPAPDGPGAQETTEFDVQKHIAEAPHEEEDDDVLEETPEFLQDTPEHDRLWFEQRPPKDFDFDG